MSAIAAQPSPADDLERDVDEAIRQAGGERAAIQGLILGQREIQERMGSAISAGYVRRIPVTRST